ncbi:hypothetical protein [Sphingomonas yabuuchiae]|uniref:hypothetical protein n=1 Tax=Sphingomonas yabuuchiae TaxID=172044 RepID=UPI00128EB053|nr:hypothetical protein [Sphingomonas yabuuchiae]
MATSLGTAAMPKALGAIRHMQANGRCCFLISGCPGHGPQWDRGRPARIAVFPQSGYWIGKVFNRYHRKETALHHAALAKAKERVFATSLSACRPIDDSVASIPAHDEEQVRERQVEQVGSSSRLKQGILDTCHGRCLSLRSRNRIGDR